MATTSGSTPTILVSPRKPPVPPPAHLRALLQRVTFGYSPQEWSLLQSLGHEGYVEHHLDHLAIDDPVADALIAPLETLGMTAGEIMASEHSELTWPMNQLQHAQLLRAVASRRQLYERTVAFFNDHFSIYIKDGGIRYHKVDFDREVVRKHAFGKFPDMLKASAHAAAMLQYLDNASNTKFGPQENYARELMELHTLGVDGGYDETDVKQAAKCLTGWRYDPAWWKLSFGAFIYDPEHHDNGQKTVLGQVFPAGQGQLDGDQLLDLLAGHPSTGVFLGRKLLRWFGVYDPPDALVADVANAYATTGGDIPSMLRVVLSPQAFAAAKPWKHPKLKRPEQFLAGLFRALGATLASETDFLYPTALITEMRALGQPPFEWPTPNGYPDELDAWAAGCQPRWSLATRLAQGTCAAAGIDPVAVSEALSAAPALGWGRAIDLLLTGGDLSAADRALLDGHAAAMPVIGWPQVAELIALGASCPSYQFC